MRKMMMQQDLFREAANVERMSEDLQAEVVAQLALLIQSVTPALIPVLAFLGLFSITGGICTSTLPFTSGMVIVTRKVWSAGRASDTS